MASTEILNGLQQPKIESVWVGGERVELINLSGDGLTKVITDLRVDGYNQPAEVLEAA